MFSDSGLWAALAVVLPLLAAAPFVAAAAYILVRVFKASARDRALLATGEAAQMVKAFLVSTEYRQRFGQN